MSSVSLSYKKIENIARNYGKAKNRKVLAQIVNKQNIVLFPAIFLLSRARLIDGMMPFGVAAYAAVWEMNINKVIAMFLVILGMVTSGAHYQVYINLSAILLFNMASFAVKNIKQGNYLKPALISLVSVLIPETVMVYMQGMLLYDMLIALFYAFVVFSLVFVFKKAASIVDETRKRIAASSEETISAAIAVSLMLTGISDLSIFGLSVKNVLCILLILIFSYKSGPAIGASVGVTVGLIVSMSSVKTPLVIGSYAFCGLLSGVFRNLGKIGSGLGFILANAVLTIYINGSTDVLIYLGEIGMAIVIFMVLPSKAIKFVTEKFTAGNNICLDKAGYASRIKDITVEKLNNFSKAFQELSKTFSEISQTGMVTDMQDISTLFDRIADRVCKGCGLCSHCWDRNFYNTYQVMFKIIERLDKYGRIDADDIPANFIERCGRINEFIDAVNNIYEIFKVDMVWKNRLGESRGIVSRQLYGISKVISNLASEINSNVLFRRELEDIIAAELLQHGVKLKEVVVSENKFGKYEINIIHKGCGGRRDCIKCIEKIAGEIVGRKMTKEGNECGENTGKGLCVLKLIEEEVYNVTTGVSRMPKYNCSISGDSYTFMNTGNGKYIIALSDGMGTGQKAAAQSKAAISLLEQFMEAGFDKDMSMQLINSILVLKSSEDSFATIDLSVIDLYNSEVEFVKIGAVPTFIKRADNVESVKSVSLPAGILSDIETELIHKKVESGDFIIMMSDGVIDSFKGEGGGESAVKALIRDIKSINPQEIADIILDKAYQNSGGKPEDDMMVLVAKVWGKIA